MLEVRGIVPAPGPLLLVLDLRDRLECTGLANPLDLNSAVHKHIRYACTSSLLLTPFTS